MKIEIELFEKKLKYLKNILNLSNEMYQKYEEDKFNDIKVLLLDREEFINKVSKLEQDISVSNCNNIELESQNLSEEEKKVFFDIKITLEKIKSVDNQIYKNITKKKNNIENEMAALVKEKRRMSYYKQSEDVEFNIDVVQ